MVCAAAGADHCGEVLFKCGHVRMHASECHMALSVVRMHASACHMALSVHFCGHAYKRACIHVCIVQVFVYLCEGMYMRMCVIGRGGGGGGLRVCRRVCGCACWQWINRGNGGDLTGP